MSRREFGFGGQPSFYIRHIIKIENTLKGERLVVLTIGVSSKGKIRNHPTNISKATMNNYMRNSLPLIDFAEEHRLEFLTLTGKSINQMIIEAVERYKKHYKTRYNVKFNPDHINIPEV